MAMRRTAALIVFTIFAVSFTACGRKAPPVMPQQGSNVSGGAVAYTSAAVTEGGAGDERKDRFH